MLIYADTNIYCRPLDDHTQQRVALEAEACLSVFKMAAGERFSLLSSDILHFELNKVNLLKKLRVQSYLLLCEKHINQSEMVKVLAEQISSKYKISPRDAIHLSSASLGKAKIFLTCDDDLLKNQLKFRGLIYKQ